MAKNEQKTPGILSRRGADESRTRLQSSVALATDLSAQQLDQDLLSGNVGPLSVQTDRVSRAYSDWVLFYRALKGVVVVRHRKLSNN